MSRATRLGMLALGTTAGVALFTVGLPEEGPTSWLRAVAGFGVCIGLLFLLGLAPRAAPRNRGELVLFPGGLFIVQAIVEFPGWIGALTLLAGVGLVAFDRVPMRGHGSRPSMASWVLGVAIVGIAALASARDAPSSLVLLGLTMLSVARVAATASSVLCTILIAIAAAMAQGETHWFWFGVASALLLFGAPVGRWFDSWADRSESVVSPRRSVPRELPPELLGHRGSDGWIRHPWMTVEASGADAEALARRLERTRALLDERRARGDAAGVVALFEPAFRGRAIVDELALAPEVSDADYWRVALALRDDPAVPDESIPWTEIIDGSNGGERDPAAARTPEDDELLASLRRGPFRLFREPGTDAPWWRLDPVPGGVAMTASARDIFTVRAAMREVLVLTTAVRRTPVGTIAPVPSTRSAR